jgi:hypothetical protein
MKRTEHRPRSEPAFDRGPGSPELSAYGGIISGYLASYAAAWETTPAAVLSAIERAGLTPMVDTAQPANAGLNVTLYTPRVGSTRRRRDLIKPKTEERCT